MDKEEWATWRGHKMSEALIAGDEDQIWSKFHVLNIFAALCFELDLGFKQSLANFLISRSFSYQNFIILNWSPPPF